jgi:hypothetical protein
VRRTDVESWAAGIADIATAGGRVEDSRVELKSKWPDDLNSAARQIAGLANAARGEPVLWLVGVSDAGQVLGAPDVDPNNWWAGVRTQFNEDIAPDFDSFVVPYKGESFVAVCFECSRVPFVVVNKEKRIPHLETPWREGTSLRSARRSDLLRMLTPVSRLPQIDVLTATARLTRERNSPDRTLSLQLNLYFYPPQGTPVYLPDHRSDVSLQVEGTDRICLPVLWLSAQDPSLPVYWKAGQVLINAPGTAFMQTTVKIPKELRFSDLATLTFRWQAGLAGQDGVHVVVAETLTPDPAEVRQGPVSETLQLWRWPM